MTLNIIILFILLCFRYVATPYVEASSYLSKLLEEEKKLDASKTVAGTGTSTPSMRTPGQTPLDSPCPSPGPSTQSTETMGKL